MKISDLRWKAPQPAKPWEGTLKADDFAPWPPQPRQMSAQLLCGNSVGFGGFWPCVDGYVITDDKRPVLINWI